MTSQKLNFRNYGFVEIIILKEHDEKCLLANNQHLIAILGVRHLFIYSIVMLLQPHTNPCNFVLNCMESLEHKSPNISLPDFWQVGIFHHDLCEHLNKSHNFTNSNIICDVTL